MSTSEINSPATSLIEIPSSVAGSVWQILASADGYVRAGEPILILESMKLEIEVNAPASGTVAIHVAEGQVVAAGDVLASLQAE